MASVTLSLPPASFARNRNKVTIAGYPGTVTLDIARPEVTWDAMADNWEETDRGSGYPISEPMGKRLRRFSISAVLTKERDANPSGEPADVHQELIMLTWLASTNSDNRAITVAYDALTRHFARWGGWVIADLSFRSVRRRPSDNHIIRAEVDISFMELARPVTPLRPGTAAAPASAPRVGPAPAPSTAAPVPAQRRHTIGRGETLWAIALRYYGNGAHWQRIANANAGLDPRRLTVGRVITIP